MPNPYQIKSPGGVEILSNATISGSITANGGISVPSGYTLAGTASYAVTASYALSSPGGGPGGDTTAVEAQLWFLI